MNLRIFVVGLALPLVLAACAGRTVRPDLPDDQIAAAEARQVARESLLRMQPDWSMSGRIAVATDGRGGSGKIEWHQSGQSFEVSLSAPVTRQSWRLTGAPGDALLEGLEGGVRHGDDARSLLLQATGWDIPVVALSDWVRGLRAPGLGSAEIVYGADGLPSRIDQGGWQIQYTWPAADATAAPLLRPLRIDARRDAARVRLVVDDWALSPDQGVPAR
ncbi:MAG: lipoprotein insertase outer membrane protein LolB [Pseudomonadota bacterium]|nr:lipoprotein insertase outer membrane protein LolB [Pseudomonadota bacterium]